MPKWVKTKNGNYINIDLAKRIYSNSHFEYYQVIAQFGFDEEHEFIIKDCKSLQEAKEFMSCIID